MQIAAAPPTHTHTHTCDSLLLFGIVDQFCCAWAKSSWQLSRCGDEYIKGVLRSS